ncbi:essential MCU regulator, mitochondrial-like isoform X2 [Convolutriloba macropyga]
MRQPTRRLFTQLSHRSCLLTSQQNSFQLVRRRCYHEGNLRTNVNGGIATQPYQNLSAIVPEAVVFPGMILAGAWVAKQIASFLEESDIFVYEDDD